MGEPEGVGDDGPRGPVVLAGETDMAEGGGGEVPRKADLNPSRGAATMFWVVGMAAGEGGVRLGGSLAAAGESGAGGEVGASAMDVRARESAMSWGESCFEDVRPSFFAEDWPWPIVSAGVAGGGGRRRGATGSRRQKSVSQRNDRGDTPRAWNAASHFGPITLFVMTLQTL